MNNLEKGEEQKRLDEAREKGLPWKKWGPYLSERQWGTVRGVQYLGRHGGGWVRIVSPNVVVNGSISASGGTGTGYQAGSGSGGIVNIKTSTIEGSGAIATSGVGNEVGGGGGRISVKYDLNNMNQGQFQSNGGHGGNSSGQAGTVVFPH